MAIPYITGNITGSLYSGSFLNETDTNLFYTSQSADVWFGLSVNDVIEISVLDINENLIAWDVLKQEKTYRTASLTYIDDKNVPIYYTYLELIPTFDLYKNEKILTNVVDDLNMVGITEGTYKVSYIFNKLMAGKHDNNQLIIKDISPSRKEIKIVSSFEDPTFKSFCLKKFEIRDVASLVINLLAQCPYSQIYNAVKEPNKDTINFLKTIFFLPDDGTFLLFLKNMYEDVIKYTNLTSNQISSGITPTQISRDQGIKTYFNNLILQNYNGISDFNELKDNFILYVNKKINQKFNQFQKQTTPEYLDAQAFLRAFFVDYFYSNIINPFQQIFENKYFSYFKNVLNFGNNKTYTILTHDSVFENGQLTLLLKMENELPSDISIKDNCWVSNYSITPSLLTVILQNPIKYSTVKISPPNFGIIPISITQQNVNKLYSSDDLKSDSQTEDQITVNKNISKLNIDYSDFSNFIVFSSIKNRINIFKNKIVDWYNTSASAVLLENVYAASLTSSTVYQYYSNEKDSYVQHMSDIINSFDNYESYLFNNKNYTYLPESSSFSNVLYVENQDELANEYDKNNRDSLINNVPEYIINDSNNEEYLIFLSMIGHYFDNIYVYISSLPIEKQVHNEFSSSLSTKTIKEILTSFGWNVNDLIGDLDIDEVYLNSLDNTIYNTISTENRLKIIWNRILVNLPGIYKTKGTEACVGYLLSCYGIPSSLLSIREYGGIDYTKDPIPSYRLDEDAYFLKFSGINDYISGPYPSSARTIEFKFAVENIDTYPDYKFNPLFTVVPYPHVSSSDYSWNVGIIKTPGQYMGQVKLQMGSGSTGASIITDPLPIFNGELFSVMIRRNYPYHNFETSIVENNVPIEYDLYVQRNETGRIVFQTTASNILLQQDNQIFNQFGHFYFGNSVSGSFIGLADKLHIWDIPVSNDDFNCHVNDLNCYGFSGSNAEQHLWIKLQWDYPQTMSHQYSGYSAVWVNNNSSYYSIPYYYSGDLNSSPDPLLYSASLDIINTKWITYYPTGSVDIIAFNFPKVIDPNWSSSFDRNSCTYVSQSVFPYNFRQLNIIEELDTSKYGPNKFKNNKVRKIEYELSTRLDVRTKSADPINTVITSDSNQLGFFVDPNDAKNKDIIRFIGNGGIIESISDPRLLFSSRYEDLRQKNIEYNRSGNKQTYFNEMMTLYKFYFDKSIFEVIKNIVPARSNVLTGILIEPTILERPKYQHKPISSSTSETKFLNVNIHDPFKISSTLEWADFNTDWTQTSIPTINGIPQMEGYPNNFQFKLNLTASGDRNIIRTNNYNNTYFPDFMDKYQFVVYGDLEDQPRSDTISQTPIWSSLSKIPDDTKRSGSTTYYNLKIWEKYSIYKEDGPYSRTNVNSYSSNSIELYKYILVNESFMRDIIHFDTNDSSGWDIPAYNYFYPHFLHQPNTFKGTPDQIINIISSSVLELSLNPTLMLTKFPANSYFELVRSYPRNHYTHKRTLFSKTTYHRYMIDDLYIKGQNTANETIGIDGINDGSYPIQSFNVSNVNIINPTNVINDSTPRPIVINTPSPIQNKVATDKSNAKVVLNAVQAVNTILPQSNGSIQIPVSPQLNAKLQALLDELHKPKATFTTGGSNQGSIG